jgi:hypothetical protein
MIWYKNAFSSTRKLAIKTMVCLGLTCLWAVSWAAPSPDHQAPEATPISPKAGFAATPT